MKTVKVLLLIFLLLSPLSCFADDDYYCVRIIVPVFSGDSAEYNSCIQAVIDQMQKNGYELCYPIPSHHLGDVNLLFKKVK